VTPQELKEFSEKMEKAVSEMKKTNDERLKALESKGHVDPLLEEKLTKANAEIDRLQAKGEEHRKELDAIKTAMNRPGQGGDPAQKDAEKAAKDAFNKYARKGDRALNDAELKVLMSNDSNPDGGFLVRPQLSTQIVEKVFESSPIAELSDVETITQGDVLEMMEDLDEAGAGWVGEQEARTATDTPQVKQISIPLHELHASPKATNRQIDDSAWDIEAWLQKKVSDRFGRLAATAFHTGTGVKKPRGFASYASGTTFGTIEQVVSGHATLVQLDGLIALQGALKEPYQNNATFLMKRATLTNVRKLKDGNGAYVWQPSFVAGKPDMLLGRPVRMADDMAAEGAGALSVAYGDFKAGYQIVRKFGIRVLRDPFTAKGFVLFYTTLRIGGDVKNFEAIKLGKCST
jgi:HK97 family phage major capsid protein